MAILLLLIIASLSLALCALAGFVWAVKTGQFEDTCTPSMRILTDEPVTKPIPSDATKKQTTEQP